MARSIQEIYDEMIDEKENQTSLSGLTPTPETYANFLAQLASSSKVAIWRLFIYIVATSIYTFEVLLDRFKVDIEDLAAQSETGTLRWHQERALDFQFGDVLIYEDGKYKYATIDESLQVVKRCSTAERSNGVVVIKTAKLDGSGLPEPLSAAELAGLEDYFSDIKFAGTFLDIVSFPADDLKLEYNIYYSAQIPLADIQTAVFAAVNAYIEELPFDGVLNINKLTDALQVVEGVVDPFFENAEAKYGALPYVPFDREYLSNAGYLKIDPAFPLLNTFTFTPRT